MDPITIGLAFSAAQMAVGQIKQAIALGKDINGIIGFVGKFFQAADAVHIASIKAKHSSLGKSDVELGQQALVFAMHSNQLREDERALKDMIIWQLGKPKIWEDMVNERTRLLKEKREAEAAAEGGVEAEGGEEGPGRGSCAPVVQGRRERRGECARRVQGDEPELSAQGGWLDALITGSGTCQRVSTR